MDKVTINYSIDTETKRILHTIFGVVGEFYIKNGWYVLPNKKANFKYPNSVILPELKYRDLLGFGIDFNSPYLYANDSTKVTDNKNLQKIVNKALLENNLYTPISKKDLTTLSKKYNKLLIPAIAKIQQTFEIFKDHTFEIEVVPTHFGVCLSFDVVRDNELKKKHHKIRITKRIDVPDVNLLEGLASSISRGLIEQEISPSWRETEAVSDFITKFILDGKTFVPTLKTVDDYKNVEVLNQSIRYLISLQTPTGVPFNYVKDSNSIILFSNNITSDFTPYEFRVLRALLEHRNKAVSFDQISEEVYKVDADIKFTLWGITKTVQRLRDKLEEHGLPREMISNVRGEGFKLLE